MSPPCSTRLAIREVHYIGLSIGGMIGQAFALEHGARLLSAMWCDTHAANARRRRRGLGASGMKIVRDANSLLPAGRCRRSSAG